LLIIGKFVSYFTFNFMIRKFIIYLILLFGNNFLYAEYDYAYQVEFTGLCDQAEIYSLLYTESRLVSLVETPPQTAAGLQRRIDDDISILLKTLQSRGFYNAFIKSTIDKSSSPIAVQLTIDTGPLYTFASFEVFSEHESDTISYCDACYDIDLSDLDIEIGAIAYPEVIIEAEEKLLNILELRGFPLAKLTKREVAADVEKETINVKIMLQCGPKAYFGQIDICGGDGLLPVFFSRKIAWYNGDVYNPKLVQKTLNALELSGLFSSINITHDDDVLEDGTLPMHIIVAKAKQRSVGFGVGYATDLGFGANADWEHRNISGRGDKIRFAADIWQIKQEGLVRYILPDFLQPRQDLILTAEAEYENVKAFREESASFSGIIEKQINDCLRVSYGLMFTRLRNTHSDNNGVFNLIKNPIQLFWNGADRLMDPSKGLTLHLKMTPTVQTEHPSFFYNTNWFNLTAYQPIDKENRLILAGKATLGSIWGADLDKIPPSERFYAGSDNLLRGYHYLTVSPLNKFGKPIGGRSLMVFSLEARMRIKDPYGIVLFYDIGNVYEEPFPQLKKHLQSAGVGFRYHTPVGPIRLDFAVPFNPRKHLDKGFQVYFSIGQSF
jgi:translocation and assembly module TamA